MRTEDAEQLAGMLQAEVLASLDDDRIPALYAIGVIAGLKRAIQIIRGSIEEES